MLAIPIDMTNRVDEVRCADAYREFCETKEKAFGDASADEVWEDARKGVPDAIDVLRQALQCECWSKEFFWPKFDRETAWNLVAADDLRTETKLRAFRGAAGDRP